MGRSGAPDVPLESSDGAVLLTAEHNSAIQNGLLSSPFFVDFHPGEGKGSTKFLCFLHQLGDKKSTVKWNTAVKGGRMFIQLPDDPLHECSRDSLVELLDVAEGFCSEAVIFFSKQREDVKQLIRTFKFLGFNILPPSCHWLPKSQESFFLGYNLE